MTTLTIGDYSRDGLLQIVDTNWGRYDASRNMMIIGEAGGPLLVTVREMVGERAVNDATVAKARRLAKRAVEAKRSSAKLVKRSYDGVQTRLTFSVEGF